MSRITVLSPLGINRVGSQPIAPRLRSLDGVTLGVLNNSKPTRSSCSSMSSTWSAGATRSRAR